MRKQTLLSGLLLTVLALLVLAGRHAAADAPNVNAKPSPEMMNTLTARVELQVSTAPCSDFDGDGVVGIPDFLLFVNHFGTSRGDADYDAKYDLDENDVIGIPDFLIFVNDFGKEVNCSSSGSPDLIVESPSVSDNTLTTGQLFTLSATVRNQGTGSSAATTLRYYQSSDATISTSDTEVGRESVSGLSASGTSAESISLNAPLSAGTYYYGACVNSVTGESDTDNNCSNAVTVSASQAVEHFDFDLDPDNRWPEGMTFGNGRFYVVDSSDDKVYAYHASGQRDAAFDFDLDRDNSRPDGITFGNGRFYVVDSSDDKVYAYHASGQRDAAFDFDLDPDNSHPTKIIFGNGRFYVVDRLDDKVYAYHASGQRDAAFDFDLDPDNENSAGMTFGNGRFYVVDSSDDKVYAYHASGQRDAAFDFDLDPDNGIPTGMTFDNGRFYVVDSEDDKVYVYHASGQRDAAFGFVLAPDNSRPDGITFGNGRFYVVDYSDDKVYAYHASGQRDAASDFDLTPDNSRPLGITFGNGRFYVVDEGRDDKVYAYHASGQRDAASDFDLAPDNSHPTKIIFGNGRLYVVDYSDDKVYAYHASGQRDAASDFDLAPNNSRPEGITFGNGRFYVVDSQDDKVYAYHASGQRDAASDFDLAPNNSHPAGITFDNGRFYVVDSEKDKVYVLNNGPDLVVAPSVSNTNPEIGEPFVFTATVLNRGARTSTATTVRYYRSGDRRITTSDTEVGMGGISSLPTSGTSDVSISLTAPSSVGRYYYGTCVDAVSGESDTRNNCSSAVAVFSGGPFPPYDLAVRIINFDRPSVAFRYSQIRMTVEVINDGPKASKPAKLRFSGGGNELNIDIPALEPSETVLYHRTVGTARSGTTIYQVCVEAPDEETTSNNCASRSVTYSNF